MTEQDIRSRMNEAFREDRERLFKVTDGMRFQPRYAEHLAELEAICQIWRDKPSTEDYPNFTHPMALPEWFPKVRFASRWEKDVYINESINSFNGGR